MPRKFLRAGLYDRIGTATAVMAPISAFGPYVHLQWGIRIDHIFVYLVLPLITGPLILRGRQISVYIPILWAIWAGLILAVLIGSVGVTPKSDPRGLLQLAQLENFVAPLVAFPLLCIAFATSSHEIAMRRIRLACWTIAVLYGLNSLAAVLSLYTPIAYEILSLFNISGVYDRATATSVEAFRAGRSTGIFSQPLESGFVGSLALMCLAYVSEDLSKAKSIVIIWMSTLGLVFMGGVLSASKTFLVVGVVFFLVCLLAAPPYARRLVSVSLPIVITTVGLVSYFFSGEALRYLDHTWRMNDVSPGSIVAMMTANRIGTEESVYAEIGGRIADVAPWFGFGVGAFDRYDSAYLEVLAQGGFVGLWTYVVWLVLLGMIVWIRGCGRQEMVFGISLTSLVVIASVGGPVVTQNRGGLLVLILVSLLLSIPRNNCTDATSTRRLEYG